MKLKKYIMVLFFLISILPLMVFGLFSIYEINKKVTDMTECNLQAISENQVTNIQNFAKDRRSEMEMVAHYELTADCIHNLSLDADSQTDRSYLDNLLRERRKYGQYVASISILDKEFHIVASSERYERMGLSQLKEVNQRYHTGAFIMGNVYERMTDDGNKKLVPAYIGIYEEDELIGYVAEELDTSYFDDLRINMDSLAAGTFYILDGNGAIITAGDTNQKESIDHFVSSSEDRKDFQEKWDAIDHEANPKGELRYHYRGDEYITYYSNVENSDWSIRVTENYTVQIRSMYSFYVFIVLVFLTVIIGAVLVQNFTVKRILFPINNALQAFEQIRDTQDYSIRLHGEKNDELGALYDGVNELLDYVEQGRNKDEAARRSLQDQAERDGLTGIKNHKAIEVAVLNQLELSSQSRLQIVFGFLDVDNFREFNTKYGHQAGDLVLKFVADTLKSEVFGKLNGEIGRIGGDEFVFCVVKFATKEEIEANIQRLLDTLRKGCPNPWGDGWFSVPCSIGVVSAAGSEVEYTELVRAADKAMYKAKDAGRNTYYICEM